jgi:hypothetical protein
MSISLIINVPNIDEVINYYDSIRVYRSDYPDANFTEITDTTETTATVTGTQVGPLFNHIANKTLSIRTRNGITQNVTFTTASNPVNIDNLITMCDNAFSGIIASKLNNYLKLETDDVGADTLIQILNSTAVDDLGFKAGQYATGQYKRIELIDGQTEYLFEDINGDEDKFYKTAYYNSSTEDSSADSDTIKGRTAKVYPETQSHSTSPRGLTLLRGESHIFRQSFFEDENKYTPVTPIDTGKYPRVNIVNINGEVIISDIATLDGTPGNYRYNFQVPLNAEISNDDRRWRIEWYVITNKNRQIETVLEFDIRDSDFSDDDLEDFDSSIGQRILAMPCKEHRVKIALEKRPYSISLDIMKNNKNFLTGIRYPYEVRTLPDHGFSLTETTYNQYYIYYFDIPEGCAYLSECSMFTLIWNIQKTPISSKDYIYRILDVPPTLILPLMTSLRMAIDKYQKQKNTVQAYQDSDLYEYLKRSREMINGYPPLTNWGFTDFPGVLSNYLLLGALVWGLNAQHLLEVDLNFDFSGQTTTLSYNHEAGISTAYDRALSLFNENIAKAKMAYSRKSRPVGIIAGRPYSFRRAEHFVFRVDTMESGDLLGLLNRIGIL